MSRPRSWAHATVFPSFFLRFEVAHFPSAFPGPVSRDPGGQLWGLPIYRIGYKVVLIFLILTSILVSKSQ
jgi:hypothetical protein